MQSQISYLQRKLAQGQTPATIQVPIPHQILPLNRLQGTLLVTLTGTHLDRKVLLATRKETQLGYPKRNRNG